MPEQLAYGRSGIRTRGATDLRGPLVFKTSAIAHSATLPKPAPTAPTNLCPGLTQP
jgi:hypothetical protein